MLLFDMDRDADRLQRRLEGRGRGNFWPGGAFPTPMRTNEGVAHTILPLAAKFTKEFCRLEESCEDIIAEWMAMAKDAYAPRGREARRPGLSGDSAGRRASGWRLSDLQRAGALPDRPDPAGPDGIL